MENPEVKISCYLLKLRPNLRGRKNPNEPSYYNFDNLTPAPNDDGVVTQTKFSDIFKSYANDIDGKFIKITSGQAFHVPLSSLSFSSAKRTITGTIQGGNTGSSKNVSQADRANDEPEFTITTDMVDHTDFHFLVYVPPGEKIGLLMVSGFTTFSIAETFSRHIKKHFTEDLKIVCEIDRFVPREFLEMTQKTSKINSITLKRYDLPSDKVERLGFPFPMKGVTIEVKLKGLKNYSEKIKENLAKIGLNLGNDEPRFLSSPLLDELGLVANESDISCVYDRDGRQTTARASRNFKIHPNFYAPKKDIQYDPDKNLPESQSVIAYMKQLLEQVKVDLT
jgi:hypothetical protein